VVAATSLNAHVLLNLHIELGRDGIRANAIAPGAVEGDGIQRVLQGRAICGQTIPIDGDSRAAQ
jgi:NAD(P)-dependent dehydrogenase (short-subunit alcohol dehydrogenase family)